MDSNRGRRTSVVKKDLHANMDGSQLQTYTRWWNSYLAPRGIEVTDLCEQIKSGLLFVRLLEALEGFEMAPVRNGKVRMQVGLPGLATAVPRVPAQAMENLNLCLKALTEPPPLGKGIKLVNIGAEDLAGTGSEHEQRTLVLGLTWELIKFYELGGRSSAGHDELLEWVRATIARADGGIPIGKTAATWTSSFRDGRALAAM